MIYHKEIKCGVEIFYKAKQETLKKFISLFTIPLFQGKKMPTFRCSQCRQEKDEGEYDTDKHGILRKSCYICLVGYYTISDKTSMKNARLKGKS